MSKDQEQINSIKEDFVSLAVHQLRSPISSSRWFVNLLISGKAGALNSEQHYLLENLDDILKHINEVVEVLLRLGRIESGKIKIQPKASNLNEIIESAVASLRPLAEKKKIKIELGLSKQQLSLVMVDSEFIWQMLEILLSNAIKYSKEESNIDIDVEYLEAEIKVSIKDYGIGIPKNEQGKVFEKFYRAKNAMSLVPQGSGLGLSLAKSLAEAWGGSLGFESVEGQGSNFFFTLPKTGMKPKEGQVVLVA